MSTKRTDIIVVSYTVTHEFTDEELQSIQELPAAAGLGKIKAECFDMHPELITTPPTEEHIAHRAKAASQNLALHADEMSYRLGAKWMKNLLLP